MDVETSTTTISSSTLQSQPQPQPQPKQAPKWGGRRQQRPWQDLLGKPTRIVANPPFLPVPVQDMVISKRYGWFSSGGSSGERILKRIVQLSSQILWDVDHDNNNDNSKNNKYSGGGGGILAVVSEFMNPQSNDFPIRLEKWWMNDNNSNNSTRKNQHFLSAARAILITNEKPLSADTYAMRRSDSDVEVETWRNHLQQEGIDNISPGLLFIQKIKNENENKHGSQFQYSHFLLPSTTQGSIWTPTNRYARDFTREIFDQSLESIKD